ncbi:protein PAF1 homolog [Silene latifolia]|uniref:protein PAF1 homolog n=1 Tax=Silene latifolia TaxID=37657 RepID=UPI003D77B908
MASYRPFPPPSQPPSFAPPPPPPAQNSIPPPPRPQSHGNQFPQNWGSNPPNFPQNFNQIPPNSNFHAYPLPPPPPSQQPPQYQFQPPPPPPDSSYAPPPPPPPPGGQNSVNAHPQYFPTSQYSQFSQQQPPPPPPSSPPPSSTAPPPPPPPASPPPPPPPQNKERDRRVSKEGHHQQQHGSSRQQKPPVPPRHAKKTNGGRVVETEEERRLRKKKEMEKARQEEKHKQQLKDVHHSRQKPQVPASGPKVHGSISGSRIGEKRAAPVMAGDRDENPMKRQTAFMCRMKFRNELPDPSAQPKLMTLKRDKDRFTRYTITSLEKMHKPKLYVEPDLGIPLDLLDLSVYNPPREKRPLAPEDEELLRDDEAVTPLKKDGIRRKERPSDHGVSWLVKTQYISPLSNEGTKQSLTEKQAKELRELKEGRNFLHNLNDRERQIQDILASFEACKSRPVHATNKNLKPVEVLPLLPYFDRYEDQFVVANFDGEPTADAEMFSKMPKTVREEIESKAVMKSFTAPGSDPSKPDRFLGYMAPTLDELSKDIYDEDEDVSYTWVREYNWDVKGEDLDDLSTYFVSFDEDTARYLPLPTKLALRKRRSKEGKSQDENEQFVAPGKLTVRRRETTSVIEQKESMNQYSRHGASTSQRVGYDFEDDDQEPVDGGEDDHMGQYSGAEADEYMSD